MAHTNSTPNYNLPQFLGTDKPAWLTDINAAMSDIDTAIAAAKSTADSASTGVSALGITVGNHTTQLSTLSGAVTSQGNTLNTVTALIGNGTPTTTDQTIIGAINEIVDKTFYKEVHTAAANQTWAAQLTELKTYFDALSSQDKVRAVLLRNANVYRMGTTLGHFSLIDGDNTGLYVNILRMSNSTAYNISIKTDGTTTTTVTTDTDTAALTLAIVQ